MASFSNEKKKVEDGTFEVPRHDGSATVSHHIQDGDACHEEMLLPLMHAIQRTAATDQRIKQLFQSAGDERAENEWKKLLGF